MQKFVWMLYKPAFMFVSYYGFQQDTKFFIGDVNFFFFFSTSCTRAKLLQYLTFLRLPCHPRPTGFYVLISWGYGVLSIQMIWELQFRLFPWTLFCILPKYSSSLVPLFLNLLILLHRSTALMNFISACWTWFTWRFLWPMTHFDRGLLGLPLFDETPTCVFP